DSLLPPDELERRFRAIEAVYRRRIGEDPDADYLGARPEALFSRAPLSALAPHLRYDRLRAAFRTAELAIDTQELADVLRAALAAEPRVNLLADRTVETVE